MKKISSILLFVVVVIFTVSSCNTYHSINTASNVRQLSANPFMQKVARSVIQNMTQEVIDKGLTSFKGKPLLRSTLSSLLNTPQSVSAFKNMVSATYGISQNRVNENYSKWSTVRDVIGFVANNGKRFDFNSYSNKLF